MEFAHACEVTRFIVARPSATCTEFQSDDQQDGETEILANSYGASALLDKAKLFDELIPAIQRASCQHGQHLNAY
jgi:hypothetical protein